jgi:hypothetical protein
LSKEIQALADRPPVTEVPASTGEANDEELVGEWVQTDIFYLLDTKSDAPSTEAPVETVEARNGD